MSKILIKNARLVNRGTITEQDIYIVNDRIERIDNSIDVQADETLDCDGAHIIPGIIDDQVHFREPGLTHKADIASESRAAAAGGVTSFMEMPNTKPPATTQAKLQDKYDIAARNATVNYSFYMGASNDNIEEVLKTDGTQVCGIKIFMGSSTGNMLVDDTKTLENLFSKVKLLIATHCEDEATIRDNLRKAQEEYGDDIPVELHPVIRSREGCYLSSSMATELAREYGTRLHVLHISTADEIALFDNNIPIHQKNVTSEVCVHHLFFDSSQYKTLGSKIKCNPAIKSGRDKAALLQALKDGYFDVIATDHAPHTLEEKAGNYMSSPSGLPLIQTSLSMMLDFYHKGDLSFEFIVDKMCHKPAELFDIVDRGFLDEGSYADLAIVDLDKEWQLKTPEVYYKCGWSPVENMPLKGKVVSTLCNGQWVYKNEKLTEIKAGQRLKFNPRNLS